MGLGNVGKRLAYMAQLLGWKVIGFDPYVQLDSIENVSFQTLLQQANAVSIHVPLTKKANMRRIICLTKKLLQRFNRTRF